MKVNLIPTVNEAKQENLLRRTVAVIDVLRSTSTIVAAFLAGCTEVLPVETSGQALALKNEDTILAGERFCKKIQGFDFSNSPTQLIQQKLANKRLVLTTTNGTRAIQKALRGEHVLIASFLNASAVANKIIQLNKDATLFCSGTRDEFALEDGLCAGLIISRILEHSPLIELDDLGKMAHAAYQSLKHDLSDVMSTTITGKRLSSLDLHDDLTYCSQLDICDLVPCVKDERIFVPAFS